MITKAIVKDYKKVLDGLGYNSYVHEEAGRAVLILKDRDVKWHEIQWAYERIGADVGFRFIKQEDEWVIEIYFGGAGHLTAIDKPIPLNEGVIFYMAGNNEVKYVRIYQNEIKFILKMKETFYGKKLSYVLFPQTLNEVYIKFLSEDEVYFLIKPYIYL